MHERKRITLEKIIDLIGDDVGFKYTWFLLRIDAQGIIDPEMTLEDINDKIRSENLGYYEISWQFIRQISRRVGAVVDFHLVGTKNKENFLTEREKLDQNIHDWTGFVSDFELYIEDGEIWEITGTDTFLVKRLQKIFSTLPRLLE